MSPVAIFYNVRSAENVGAMFRTADAAGVSRVYLAGYTPGPIDRFARPRKDIAKSALGAEKTLPWVHVESVAELVLDLKRNDYFVVAIEQAENSVDYKKVEVKGKMAFIVGNEVSGIEKEILELADVVAEIPMRGEKESLNVSTAFGIALFRILDK